MHTYVYMYILMWLSHLLRGQVRGAGPHLGVLGYNNNNNDINNTVIIII